MRTAGDWVPDLVVTVSRNRRSDVITVHGDVDSFSAPTLEDALTTVLAGAPDLLVIDLSKVTFLASAGLSALIRAHTHPTVTGVVRVVASRDSVAWRPLDVSGLAEVLDVYTSIDTALVGTRR